jgi:TonB-dependent receptor
MRRVSILLVSTSVLVAAGASPAFGKAQPVPPPDPNATAQQNPAQPSTNADAPADNAIVVTGLRRSLQSARNIKRNSDQVIDAIVAEDIGKLPDITVSDTAARIPGVSVERNRGEAGRVIVRGLDNTYYTTTYDSREIFTAEARSVALQDFPSGAVAAIEAFKTSTANLVEPGIAGLVNVRSRRPFDFKGLEVDGSVWALYPRQSRDLTPNGNILISNRWQVGDEGEVGALLNFSYTQLHYRDSIRRYDFNIANLAGGRAPDWPQIHYDEGNRKRPSINGAIQWRPHPGLEFYLEGLWQGYRDNWTDRELDFPLWGAAGANYQNIVLDQGRVISGTVINPGTCCTGPGQFQGDINAYPRGFQGATKRRTNTYQFAVGGSYDAGPVRISADLAHTTSTFKLFTESVDFVIPTHNFTVDWYNGLPGSYGPTFNVTGLDFTNPANYYYRGFYEERQRPHGQDWQGRLDFEYTPRTPSALSKIQWGFRYVDRDASDQFGNRYWFRGDRGIPISAVPLTYVLYPGGFRGDPHAPNPITWIGPTFDSVWADLVGLRQFNISFPGGTAFGSNDANDPAIDPTTRFNINEKSYAGYAQVGFRIGEGQTYADGILGMRVVRTDEDIRGFASTVTPPAAPVVTPVDYKNGYWDWLPNANLNIHFGRDLVLRLAATKTRTRPTFQQLNPRLALVDTTNGACNPSVTSCVLTGSAGNPFLEPLKSANYDASLEYYFSPTGYASIGAFHRDMKGFIANQLFTYPGQTANGYTIQVNAPVNTNKALIDGVEAQVRTFFDFGGFPDWLRSFGIEANATYVNARADINFAGGIHRLPIPDVSKWTFNLVGMYERGPLSVRLALNRRSSYPEGPIDFRSFQGHAQPGTRLDLSTSYTLNDNLTFFFDWTNMLNKPFRSNVRRLAVSGSDVITAEEFPMLVRYEEEIFSGGVRFHFGRDMHRAAPPPVVAPPPPPPPPPPPVVEQPSPPPPPPPAPERGG